MFKNIPFLSLLTVTVTSCSLYVDWGSEAFMWFQRSGSFMVLIGALLGYRSIMRLGVKGVGGVNDNGTFIGKIEETYESEDGRQMVKFAKDPERETYLFQVALDKVAGFLGAIFAVLGTIIWGYGDLVGRLL